MKKTITLLSSLNSKKALTAFCLMLILTFLSKNASANGIDNTIFTYEPCTGFIKITYNVENVGCGTCDDDWLTDGKLYYKNTSNNWVLFHTYVNSCGSNGCSDNGTPSAVSY